jgi:hypothetical protein
MRQQLSILRQVASMASFAACRAAGHGLASSLACHVASAAPRSPEIGQSEERDPAFPDSLARLGVVAGSIFGRGAGIHHT